MNRKRVLIIDDEEDFCNFTKMYLENKHDFEVQTLTDSREAIRVVKTFMPDIIILDLLMPHIGGFEICELLNKDDETKGVPVIVTTALSDRADIKKAYKVGASGYIVKPLEFPQLVEEINKALNL